MRYKAVVFDMDGTILDTLDDLAGQEEAVLNEHKNYYPLHSCDMTRPYDGIVELLRTLKDHGVKTAVVSNKSDSNVRALVSRFFDGLFDDSIGSMEGVARKPAPDMVNMALDRLGVPKEDAVYIGDSEVDLNTARNSLIDMITVTWASGTGNT